MHYSIYDEEGGAAIDAKGIRQMRALAEHAATEFGTDDPRYGEVLGRYSVSLRSAVQRELMADDPNAAKTAHAPANGRDCEESRSELPLLWALGWPLLFARVIDEFAGMTLNHLTGQMNDTDQAAAYNTYNGQQFTLVLIFGAQQALYTMVPQATGAGRNKQVGVVLQLVLFWVCAVLGLPTFISWIYMGEAMDMVGMLSNAAPTCTDPSAGSAGGDGYGYGPEETQEKMINSYSHACTSYLAPYIIAVTLTTW